MKRSAAVVGPMLALVLAACGSSSLSDTQLRASAKRICTTATEKTERIPTPPGPAQASAYLERGVMALTPEVTQLRALHPSSDLAGEYRTALDAASGELTALRSAVRGLKAGDDPVVEVKTLQHRLAPLEKRGNAAWGSVDVDACVTS